MPKLPEIVRKAIKAGPIPTLRPVADMVANPKTDGEKVIAFAHKYLIVPEGMLIGQTLVLDPFQMAFILAVFDNPAGTSEAYLSMARRNGKTFVIAVIMLAMIIGPLAEPNRRIAAAAMSRDQAAQSLGLMIKMLNFNPALKHLYHHIPSKNMIVGLRKNVEFRAISSDAKTGHGAALHTILLDEAGQIKAESSEFVEMLSSSQSNYEDSRMFTISTQAPGDSSYLSIQLDAAELGTNPHVVSHVYAADPDCDLMDPKQWKQANPGLGKFRSLKEMKGQAEKARAMPSAAAGILNLNFNRRISQKALFMSPEVWKKCLAAPNLITRETAWIDIGLDLSQTTDLTAAVACWRDEDGTISVETHAFAPLDGVKERALRDRAPYERFASEGSLQLTPGPVVDYEWVADYLDFHYRDTNVRSIQADPWRIAEFKSAAERTKKLGFVGEWAEVRQGFITMGSLLNAFEEEALTGRLRTGSHSLLNMAASQAIAVPDAAGNRKLSKAESVSRIDPMVAALMGVYPNSRGRVAQEEFSVEQFMV